MEEEDWRKEMVKSKGRGSIMAANKCTVSTVRAAAAVHRGFKISEVTGQQQKRERRHKTKKSEREPWDNTRTSMENKESQQITRQKARQDSEQGLGGGLCQIGICLCNP